MNSKEEQWKIERSRMVWRGEEKSMEERSRKVWRGTELRREEQNEERVDHSGVERSKPER